MAKAAKAPARRKTVPATRMPQRSELVAGREDVEGIQPVRADKAKKPSKAGRKPKPRR